MNRIISAVIVLIGLAAPAWAGFDEGVAAYERGDYESALREFRPLAEQGVADAQYNLALAMVDCDFDTDRRAIIARTRCA